MRENIILRAENSTWIIDHTKKEDKNHSNKSNNKDITEENFQNKKRTSMQTISKRIKRMKSSMETYSSNTFEL